MSFLSRFRDDSDDADRVGLYVDGPNVLRSEFGRASCRERV